MIPIYKLSEVQGVRFHKIVAILFFGFTSPVMMDWYEISLNFYAADEQPSVRILFSKALTHHQT